MSGGLGSRRASSGMRSQCGMVTMSIDGDGSGTDETPRLRRLLGRGTGQGATRVVRNAASLISRSGRPRLARLC
jgi:hypothetical protein